MQENSIVRSRGLSLFSLREGILVENGDIVPLATPPYCNDTQYRKDHISILGMYFAG